MQLRVRALETVLAEKGYIDPAALDAIIEAYETKVGPHNGARVVAKAWSDPAFKRALLEDAQQGGASLGLHQPRRRSPHRGREHAEAAQHDRLHACAPAIRGKCSGLPPVWYKSAPYRSRAVNDPRGVLADFGVKLPADTEIRVWDSTAETRFIVLPMRPAGHRRLERGKARRARHARLHDRHRTCRKIRRRSRDGRHPRHGRHARLRQSRAGAERAGLPRAVGRAARSRSIAPWATPASGPSTRRATASSGCRRRFI